MSCAIGVADEPTRLSGIFGVDEAEVSAELLGLHGGIRSQRLERSARANLSDNPRDAQSLDAEPRRGMRPTTAFDEVGDVMATDLGPIGEEVGSSPDLGRPGEDLFLPGAKYRDVASRLPCDGDEDAFAVGGDVGANNPGDLSCCEPRSKAKGKEGHGVAPHALGR